MISSAGPARVSGRLPLWRGGLRQVCSARAQALYLGLGQFDRAMSGLPVTKAAMPLGELARHTGMPCSTQTSSSAVPKRRPCSMVLRRTWSSENSRNVEPPSLRNSKGWRLRQIRRAWLGRTSDQTDQLLLEDSDGEFAPTEPRKHRHNATRAGTHSRPNRVCQTKQLTVRSSGLQLASKIAAEVVCQ